MAITTDDTIDSFGTQDQIDDGTTATIANNAMGEASSAWTNDDDAPFVNVVLECQFDSTFPTVGTIDLHYRLLNIQSTNDEDAPTATSRANYLGSFDIPFGHAADSNFFAALPNVRLPNIDASQEYEFYLYNNNTGQTIGVDWNLWVMPSTQGPHA